MPSILFGKLKNFYGLDMPTFCPTLSAQYKKVMNKTPRQINIFFAQRIKIKFLQIRFSAPIFFQRSTFFDYSKHKPSGKIFVIIYKIFCRQHYQYSIFPMPIHFPNTHKKSRLKHW